MIRQLAAKSHSSHSWFTQLRQLGELCQINVDQAIQAPWPKLVWEIYTTECIMTHWQLKMVTGAIEKTTLDRMLLGPYQMERPHPL